MPVGFASVVVVPVVVGAVVVVDDIVIRDVVILGVVVVVYGNEITKVYIASSRYNYGYILSVI